MPIIRTKYSNTASNTPSGLLQGELAVNIADTKTFVGPSGGGAGTVVIGTLGAQDSNSVSVTGGTINNTALTNATLTTSSLTLSSGQTVTSVDTDGTLAANSNSRFATQAAVKTYADSKRGALKTIVSYTSAGTFSYTRSGTDVKRLRVIVVGGGGGGRGFGESGGAGGFCETLLDATALSYPITVTIGGGGAGGVYFGVGGSGTTSSFGILATATGGGGSASHSAHCGGIGGVGQGGILNLYGGGGSGHKNTHTSQHHNPGHGGASYFGGGSAGSHTTGRQSETVYAPGAGGGGHNYQATYAGHNGMAGACVIYEYK
jgi:hypothetical protein